MQNATVLPKATLAASPVATTKVRRHRRVALALVFLVLAVVALVPMTWTLHELPTRAAASLHSHFSAPALLVHYTDKQRAVAAETQWRKINGRRIDLRYYDDAACLTLVKQHRPHFLQTYRTQLSVVERADYFRYLVVWAYGGLYVDTDIEFHQPVDKWFETFGWHADTRGVRPLSSVDLVVGVEFPRPQTGYTATGWLPVQLNQFVFAGTKGSGIVKRIIDHMEVCIKTIPRSDVEKTLERTGPAAFTRAIVTEIETRGLSSKALRDLVARNVSDLRHPPALLPLEELEINGQLIAIEKSLEPVTQPMLSDPYEYLLVLPYRAFGYNPSHGIAHAPVLAFHRNQNSWRKKPGQN